MCVDRVSEWALPSSEVGKDEVPRQEVICGMERDTSSSVAVGKDQEVFRSRCIGQMVKSLLSC